MNAILISKLFFPVIVKKSSFSEVDALLEPF